MHILYYRQYCMKTTTFLWVDDAGWFYCSNLFVWIDHGTGVWGHEALALLPKQPSGRLNNQLDKVGIKLMIRGIRNQIVLYKHRNDSILATLMNESCMVPCWNV